MKKVLFATTALVATAGVAAADVSLSGYAEMGINGGTNTKDQFFTDIDVTFSMSGQTDSGIAFGTSVDLDEASAIDGSLDTTTDNDGVAIFMSGAFGRVTMGDTDGALDWALDGAGMGGAIGDNHTGHAGYYDGGLDGMYDNVVLSYAYTIGDFALLVSAELNDEAKDTGDAAVDADGSLGFGARYTAAMGGADFTFGVAMQSGQYNSARAAATTGFYATHFTNSVEGNSLDAVGASIKAAMSNGLTAVATITDFDHTQNTLDAQHTSLGLAYTAGVMTIAANMGEFDSNTAAEDRDGWGLAFNYGLGGGATFQAGYGSGSVGTAPETENYSIGIAMSF